MSSLAGRKERRLFDSTLILMACLLLVLAGLSYLRGGSEMLGQGFSQGGVLLARFAPIIVVSLLAAGFADQLLPRDAMSAWMGEESGLRGILLGTAAGILTPSGPFIAMPLAVVLLRGGAATGAVVAFLSGWALLALHRLVAWEVPILGWRFALLRYAVCLALPVLAGLLARVLVR